jgi:hypothetical protein
MLGMTASATAVLQQAPSAVEVDRLAIEFLALESKVDDAYRVAVAADEPYEYMKEELIYLVEEHGSTYAEKSQLLHGLHYEIMATFGMTTTIDAARGGALRASAADYEADAAPEQDL